MARMVPQSKIIFYHQELQAALSAALKVADKKLYGSVQFRPRPDDNQVDIVALNKVATFVATVPTEMCDIDLVRDEVFECPLPEAAVLAKFPIRMPSGSDGEPAMAGLIVSDRWIQITDETGLGIGIRHVRVRRNSRIELPGDATRTIDTASNDSRQLDSVIYPAQLALAGKVCEIMGVRVGLRCLETPPGVSSRILVSGSMFSLTVTGGFEQPEGNFGDGGADDLELSYEDKLDAAAEQVLRIVDAAPLVGL